MDKIKTAVWQQWDDIGLEYLELIETGSQVRIDSTIIGFEGTSAFRMCYQLHCDENYQVDQLRIDISGQKSSIILKRNRSGNWSDGSQRFPQLDGCIDIDITATPFTNTLPIRRLDWQVGQTRLLNMVYIRIPELIVERAEQQYTCLEKHEQGSLFEFRQEDFTAILPIDADGFVQNYPELFRRLS